jgi:hypothetical protein
MLIFAGPSDQSGASAPFQKYDAAIGEITHPIGKIGKTRSQMEG